MRSDSTDAGPEAARRILDAVPYLTLATADADGRPWATPVWFVTADHRSFVWVSSPSARHSQNIEQRPDVGIVVFDSTQVPGTGVGVYVAARAELVPEPALDEALAVYAAGCRAQGLPVWGRAKVSAGARHRLYRAVATEWFVNDDRDVRVRVDLAGPPGSDAPG